MIQMNPLKKTTKNDHTKIKYKKYCTQKAVTVLRLLGPTLNAIFNTAFFSDISILHK